MSLTSTSYSGSSKPEPLSSFGAPSFWASATADFESSVVGAVVVSVGAAAGASSRVMRLAREGAAVSAGAGESDIFLVGIDMRLVRVRESV